MWEDLEGEGEAGLEILGMSPDWRLLAQYQLQPARLGDEVVEMPQKEKEVE